MAASGSDNDSEAGEGGGAVDGETRTDEPPWRERAPPPTLSMNDEGDGSGMWGGERLP